MVKANARKKGGKTLDLHLSSRHKQNEYENLAFSTRTLVTKGIRGFNQKNFKDLLGPNPEKCIIL